jgi:hypothetical protein
MHGKMLLTKHLSSTAMENERRITVEKYASQHRESIFKVLKRVNSGALRSVVEENEGKKTTYIILSDDEPAKPAAKEPEKEAITDYKAAYENLKKEYDALKAKFDALQKEPS